MQVLLGVFIFIGYVLLVLSMRSLTTLFHELGHAIPSLLFTKHDVLVFVGTYGDVTDGIKLRLGRLKIFFKLNFLGWNMGMCQHRGVEGLWKNTWVIIGGPIASLLICIPLIAILIINDLSDLQIGIIMIFVSAAALDFLINMSPFGTEIKLDNGSVIMSDGQKLAYMFNRLRLPEEFFTLEAKLEAGYYDEVISQGKDLMMEAKTNKAIYLLVINAYKKQNKYKEALAVYEQLNDSHKLSYQDFHNIGKINMILNRPEEAMKFFNHCIHHNHRDGSVLMDRAMVYKDRGEYPKAKMDLDGSLYHHAKNPIAYMERGFIHLKLENLDESFSDLEKAKSMNDRLPYIYYYLGLYYEKIKDFTQALVNFNKAKAMNIEYHGIDYKIHMVEERVKG